MIATLIATPVEEDHAEDDGVVVDELAGAVAMRCPRCGRGGSAATARLIAACRASIEAHRAA
ncbi:hypothetical protein ACSHWB_46355 [Lentzea sp. HUAS TT2]|uniref:hypothetical protein n=1 Tax=Lentzea sp. HUAS TT2 TaxID=3447454 RepID=UPI003F71F128